MKIILKKAIIEDAEVIREVLNQAFYKDYIKYGYCPAYNQSIERVQKGIENSIPFKILVDEQTVGYMRVLYEGQGRYWLACLCIIPAYENKGVGKVAMKLLEKQFPNAKCWGLDTPVDNERNVYFYKKCGFKIIKEYMDENVKLVVFNKIL